MGEANPNGYIGVAWLPYRACDLVLDDQMQHGEMK